jgi:hypothetical protein
MTIKILGMTTKQKARHPAGFLSATVSQRFGLSYA